MIRASGPKVAQPLPQIDTTVATTIPAEFFPNRICLPRFADSGKTRTARSIPSWRQRLRHLPLRVDACDSGEQTPAGE
jgi:hypothetical protein